LHILGHFWWCEDIAIQLSQERKLISTYQLNLRKMESPIKNPKVKLSHYRPGQALLALRD
jgi:hypothetical protein